MVSVKTTALELPFFFILKRQYTEQLADRQADQFTDDSNQLKHLIYNPSKISERQSLLSGKTYSSISLKISLQTSLNRYLTRKHRFIQKQGKVFRYPNIYWFDLRLFLDRKKGLMRKHKLWGLMLYIYIFMQTDREY